MTENVNDRVNDHFSSVETKQVRSTIKLFGFTFFEIELITLLETKTKHTIKKKCMQPFIVIGVKEENFMEGVSFEHASVNSVKQSGQKW